jgi:hypothetical protein
MMDVQRLVTWFLILMFVWYIYVVYYVHVRIAKPYYALRKPLQKAGGDIALREENVRLFLLISQFICSVYLYCILFACKCSELILRVHKAPARGRRRSGFEGREYQAFSLTLYFGLFICDVNCVYICVVKHLQEAGVDMALREENVGLFLLASQFICTVCLCSILFACMFSEFILRVHKAPARGRRRSGMEGRECQAISLTLNFVLYICGVNYVYICGEAPARGRRRHGLEG